MMRYLAPLVIFGALLALLAVGLNRDPRLVPSPLVGKPAPTFQLSELRNDARTLTQEDLKGQVSLLNVWATWCVSCRAEHAVLMDIARRGDVPIYGLNYKDERRAALRWLDRLGDPYVANAYDPDGRLGIDLGVYGTPETFVLDEAGTIAYKHVGPITPSVWQETLSPLIQQLQQERG
jgi:cytochrome c biogenesis protein CcmG/thiol:disulfide interchange protein DsbE